MRCAQVKKLLSTDYLDGLADQKTLQAIKDHLGVCALCRQTEQALVKTRVILKNSLRLEPPAEIWENIQSKILQEELSRVSQPKVSFLGWLERLLRPKPVLAAATIMAVMLVMAALNFTSFRRKVVIQDNGEETVFLYYNDYQEYASRVDLGTDIEEYFL